MAEINLNELQERLTKFKGEVVETAKQVAQESGDRAIEATSELKSALDVTNKQLSSIEEQLRAAQAQRVPGLADELKKKQFSFQALLRAQLAMKDPMAPQEEKSNPWKHAGFEKSVIDAGMQTRAADGQVAADGSQGGFLIPDEATSEIIDMVIADMPMMRLGPTILRGLTGDLPIPTVTGRPTGYMVSETEAPASSTAAFGEVIFRPKKVAAFVKQSKRLIYQSRGVAEMLVRKLIAEALQLKMEAMLINGSGSDKQPQGILNGTGFTTGFYCGDNASSPSGRFKFDHLRKALKTLDVADELKPTANIGILTRPEVKCGLKGQTVAQYSGQASKDAQPILFGLTVKDADIREHYATGIESTTLFPFSSGTLTDVLVGNFSQFYVGMWRGFQLLASDTASDGAGGSAFLQDQLYIVAFQEFDSHVTRGSAFTKVTSAETNESNW